MSNKKRKKYRKTSIMIIKRKKIKSNGKEVTSIENERKIQVKYPEKFEGIQKGSIERENGDKIQNVNIQKQKRNAGPENV